MPRSPRSPLPALSSAVRLTIAALIATALAVSGMSPASAEEVPPAAPIIEPSASVAPTPEDIVSPAVSPEGASIQGAVTVTDGMAALDVSVSAYRHNGTYFEYAAGVTTAGEGAYVIDGLEPGTYTLQFSPQFGSALIAEWWNDQAEQWSADSFEVADGSTVSGMDAQLAIGGAVDGVVTGPGGGAVPYATVTAYAYDDGQVEHRGSASTDESGAFAIRSLPAGTYTLQFSPPWNSVYSGEWWNDKPDRYSADAFSVVGGEIVSGMSAELAAGGAITGLVTGSEGLPLDGISVSAMGSGTWASAVTDADGQYELAGLASGDYTVSFQPGPGQSGPAAGYLREYWDDKQNQFEADRVSVGAGEVVSGVDARLARAGEISGTVAAGGEPIAGVQVSVSGPGWGSATTDAEGHYRVVGLAPGSYNAWFTMPSGSPYFNGSAPVQVTAGGTATLDYTPAAAARVVGRITAADTDGSVAGATVTLHAFGGSAAGSATTDGDGKYSIAPVQAGRYLLEVSGPGIDTTWSGGSSTRSGASVFSVAAAGETAADIVALAGASGVIAGTVSALTTNGTGPADGAFVELHTERGVLRSTVADAHGLYRFEGLEPGQYAVRFKQSMWSSSSWWWDGTRRMAASFFQVGSTDTVTHDFTIPGVGWISAKLDVDGPFTGYLRVEAVDPVTGEVVSGGTQFEDGNEYTVFDVPAGDVKVRFTGPIRDTWWGGTDFASAQTLVVPVGGEARADAALVLDTVLTGVVSAPDGLPLAEASVLIRPADGSAITYASTDATGTYRVTGLEAGSYTVSGLSWSAGASSHHPVVVEIGADATAITQDIRLDQDVKLIGTLTYLGQPVEGCVSARVVGAGYGETFCTDSTGLYEQLLQPGEYEILFRTAADVGAASTSRRVSVTPDKSGTIEFDTNLETGGVIEGRVSVDLGAGPEPVEGIFVSARAEGGAGGAAMSAADGTYRIWGLQNDVPHSVQFGYVWNDLGTEWWQGASTPHAATMVVPGVESTTGIDAELTRGGGISGRVVDADGLGTLNTTVGVYSSEGELVGEVNTNSQGAYLLTGLSAGEYKLRFAPSAWSTPDYLPEWWHDAASATSATVVEVVAGEETSGIDAALNEVGTVAVELTAPQVTGSPAVGETVTATAASTTDGASLSYEWLADDAVVAGANDSAFVITTEEVGKRMSVRVSATAAGYLPTVLTSAQTNVVAPAKPDPILPSISGAPVVGSKLEVQPGEKSLGTAFVYQWLADGDAITGADDATLRLASEQEGARIEVLVTTIRRGVVLERRTAEPTLRVLRASTPTVSGTLRAGSTLTASPGIWTAGTQHAYQWLADGVAIDGATAATFDLTPELVGARIQVSASGSLPGYPTVERSSKPSLEVRR